MPTRLIAAAAFPGMAWLYSTPHHGAVAHAFVSLVVLAVILGFVGWAFRRKAN